MPSPARAGRDWRDIVAPAEAAGGTALALGVDVLQRAAAGRSPWAPRALRPATAASARARPEDVVLGLRPLVHSDRTSAWVRTGVSWEQVRRPGDRFRPEQARWFAELHSIAREVRTLATYADLADWLVLDTVESALVWHHLAAAGRCGIPLTGARGGVVVTLHADGETAVEVMPADGGGLDLIARGRIGDSAAEVGGVVGRSGIYAFDLEAGSIDLAPAAVGPAAARLLDAGGRARIPLAETAEFLGEHYHELTARESVRTSRAVAVPPPPHRHRELAGTPEITVTAVESTDPDWLDLGILVTIDGHRIPFAPLFAALTQRRTTLRLADGTSFSLAHPALQRLRELIDEAGDLAEWQAGPRLSRYQVDLWADFEDLAHESLPAVAWRERVADLRAGGGDATAPEPPGLSATLRPYQRAGFSWLATLWRHRLGGILADDMGLGKTLQVLALFVHAREHGEGRPFLVVAPTSVTAVWRDEAARFAPGLRVHVAASSGESAADADVVVTSYTVLRRDAGSYAARRWGIVILDEAQFAKNPDTQIHRAAAALDADAVFALTGTPIENSLTELRALTALTAPGLFPSAARFRRDYVGPIEKGKVPENQEGGAFRAERLDRLRRRLRPFLLRRTKDEVAADLPPRQEQILPVELSPAHRARYDLVLQRERQKIMGLLPDLDRTRFIVFRSLTLLRLLSMAPGLVDPADAAIGSAKVDVLVEHLREAAAEGHRSLVFSQFTSFLDLVEARLAQEGLGFVRLDGSTRHRDRVVERFRDGTDPVFLISLKAGGFGLTLTEADYVFVADPWWNLAAEAQAIDRTHRIGQTKPVLVYRLIAAGTIEDKVLALQQRKARLVGAVLDHDAFSQALGADDIRALLAD
ncbi:DEAD/DEAH box helicase [Microbacterium aureliae]